MSSIVVYNLQVQRTIAILGICSSLGLISSVGLLGLSGCKKTTATGEQDTTNTDIGKTFEPSTTEQANATPIKGIDLSGLNESGVKRFNKLADKLASPCNKPHSLRTSTGASCVRTPFALRFVVELIRDGATDKDIIGLYQEQYSERPQQAFKLDGTNYTGPNDAAVKIVEFYDYGCGACQAFAPELDSAVKALPNDVVVYYKQFPLTAHPDSGPAAQAALAAGKQGKFPEMHKLLFQNAPRHKLDNLKEYAETLGLNMDKFLADYQAAAPVVSADKNEGIAAGVNSTPTTYINGRSYNGPHLAKYVQLFLEEEIAASR